jgi:hypothetical protein
MDIRISTQHGKAAQGNDVYAIINLVSAFGPGNLHNVYSVRLTDEMHSAIMNAGDVLVAHIEHNALSARFDIRNGKSGQFLGTWAIARIPGNHTLWDATDIEQSAPARKTAGKPAVQPVAAKPVTAVTAPPSALYISPRRGIRVSA